ncbi:MAG: SMP-30/gluconolactonase/LRE family protein [Salinivirgaceae bacterium]|jgi:gluconolactonase|nr:SMP-30/gluconolactonase/LRE family protein [Salinivirgaceae bacterium]
MKYLFAIILFVNGLNVLNAQSPALSNPSVEKIASGFNFTEGPVWVENQGLLFSDIPENKVYLLDTDSVVSEYINPSGKSNGLAINNDGNLLLCQHFDRQIGIYKDGAIETVVSEFEDKRLNSPNDLVVKSSGTIYFTDPPFGLNDEGLTSDLGYAGIYCLTADGKLHLIDKSMQYPNGICFSPDESKLYVVDSQIADIYVWDVVDDTTFTNKTLFYDNPGQWGDGMKVDEFGFLYATANNGLSILSAEGELVNKVTFGSNGPSNCCWGSENDEPTMYITAGNSVFRIRNITTGTGENIAPNPIKFYPNPSTEKVIFEISPNIDVNSVKILNINGTIIEILALNESNTVIWNARNSGAYFISVETTELCFSERFIVTP